MKKPNLANVVKNTQVFMSKHNPEILTGIGIAGMLTTTVLAVKATPKALALIEDERHALKVDKLTAVETVKIAWKPYIPAALTGAISVACLIGASSVNARRTAALAAAYQLSETALTEYRDKVIETVGEKKEQTIRDNVAKERIEKNPISKSEVVITEKGNTSCFEPLSSRYFKSDIESIRRAENTLNKRLLHGIDNCISLNEFYEELGLPHTDLGEELGWNTDNLINLDISSHISDEGIPCLSIGHYNPPKYGYY